jgi:hypothetical protein
MTEEESLEQLAAIKTAVVLWVLRGGRAMFLLDAVPHWVAEAVETQTHLDKAEFYAATGEIPDLDTGHD